MIDLNWPLLEQLKILSDEIIFTLNQFFENGFDVQYKSDHSPVTSADLAVDKLAKNFLAQLTPKIPYISEETPFHGKTLPTTYWLVDPLDGTKQFMSNESEFVTSIALIHETNPICGAIIAPRAFKIYLAAKNLGCWCLSDNKKEQLFVKNSHEPPLIITSPRAFQRPETRAHVYDYYQIKRMSSAKKYTEVANGNATLFPCFYPTHSWDTAGGHCLITEAGGVVFDLQGKNLTYNDATFKNPKFIAAASKNDFEIFLARYQSWQNNKS